MNARVFHLLLGMVVLFFPVAAWSETMVVKTESGHVRGVEFGDGGNGRAFLGIPYAAPPVGDLRWRPPQPPIPWEGVLDCTKRRQWCPQPPSPGLRRKTGPQSEDCLFLNVFTAAASNRERRPVMVWIHGGGSTTGSGNILIYSGRNLAMKKGVVVVTINYRLGPLGYLAHPLLSRESEHGVSGNYGALDQIAALRWVRRNIAAFGGDPDNVTVFGESAGARAISMLLVSPLANGLFHRAIIQSGMGLSVIAHLKKRINNREPYERMGLRIAGVLGCRGTDDDLACMRSKTPQEILQAARPKSGIFGPGDKFGPIIDGYLWPDSIGYLYATGRHPDIPVMMGTNRDEGSYLIAPLKISTVEQYRGFLKQMSLGSEGYFRELLRLFPAETDEQVRAALNRLVTIGLFHTAHRTAARLLSKHNKSKVFLYHFTRAVPIPRLRHLGAFHGMEIFYAFGNLGKNPHYQPEDFKLSEAMMSYWTNFAKRGDPNGRGLPHWPAYSEKEDQYMELGGEIKPKAGLYTEECDLFERIFADRMKSLQ